MAAGAVHTATVLFTDLADSTSTRVRIGEDAAEALRVEHDRLVGDAIASSAGTVVKSTGDGVMATFASAADGVAAAVAIQQAISRRNDRSPGDPLRVRIGISVGDVTMEGADCFGLPVIEAQRLEASASPGEIVCAELVMHLSRGRGGHSFESLGDLELKGLGTPVAACRVLWHPLADEARAPEIPPVLRRSGDLPFAGRESESGVLREAWKRCVAGGFEAVLVAGEPGVGKTRLVTEIAAVALDEGGDVLAGRCDEDLRVPYGPFGTALSHVVARTPSEQLRARLGRHPEELVALAPELAERLPELPPRLRAEPETERFQLFQAVTSWLRAMAADDPVILVLDDLHWADKATVVLLRHLIADAPPGVFVVGTYRDTDVARTHPLAAVLADLRRMPHVSRLALDGLDADGVRALLERTSGHELDDRGAVFASVVHDETAGNPFFVGELLRHLAETGALVQRDGRWTSDLTIDRMRIPEGIREVIGRRLSRLAPDCEAALRSAAVIGVEFGVELLAHVLGWPEPRVLDALDEAAAAALVTEVTVDRFRFAHALVRDTLHQELSSTRRVREHRKVAAALEDLHAADVEPVLAELARHHVEAAAGGDPRVAIGWAIRAGDRDFARRAPDEAAAWFGAALELLEVDHDDDGDLRRDLLMRLARAYRYALDRRAVDLARRTAEDALEAGDLALAVEALNISVRTAFVQGDAPDHHKVGLLERTLALLPPDADMERGRLLSELCMELVFVGDDVRRNAALAELDEILERSDDPSLYVQMRSAGTMSWRHVDRAWLIRDDRRRAAALRIELDAYREVHLLHSEFYGALMLGDRARRERAVAGIRSKSAPNPLNVLPDFITACIEGRLDESEQLVNAMLQDATARELHEGSTYWAIGTFAVRREQGRLAELVPLWEGTLAAGRPWDVRHAFVAFLRVATGDRDVDVEGLPSVVIADDYAWPVATALWSEVAAVVGSKQVAEHLVELLTPKIGVHAATGGLYLGSFRRLLALLHDRLERFDEADVLFAAAVADHESLGSPVWVARTHLDWAESLLRRGRRDDATPHVAAAEVALGDLDLPESRDRVARLQSVA